MLKCKHTPLCTHTDTHTNTMFPSLLLWQRLSGAVAELCCSFGRGTSHMRKTHPHEHTHTPWVTHTKKESVALLHVSVSKPNEGPAPYLLPILCLQPATALSVYVPDDPFWECACMCACVCFRWQWVHLIPNASLRLLRPRFWDKIKQHKTKQDVFCLSLNKSQKDIQRGLTAEVPSV